LRLQVQYEAEKARIVALEQSVQSKLEETLVVHAVASSNNVNLREQLFESNQYLEEIIRERIRDLKEGKSVTEVCMLTEKNNEFDGGISMKFLSKGISLQQLKQTLPLFLALILAGLAGNYFRFPIFLNIDFLFGSILAMLALQFFGLGRGILAAAIIASYTYILWNHPYAIIIMTAEVAVVGWLMGHRKIGMVLADTIYWLIVGLPFLPRCHGCSFQ